MININITKQEFIEILDDRIGKAVDEKIIPLLDERFAQFEIRMKAWVVAYVEAKFEEFAVMIRNCFQRMEDRIVNKDELRAVESRLDSKIDKGFNKVNTKIDIHQANTSRRLEWATTEIIKLKK